ncbi:MAG: orotidine-5'-phosphate decarboxylase [Candidatus Omnitrophica bacterium]|nr:orotidine-5'-phosphate decarboxylase [Candidatus Omnitrophota bacterium]
MMRDPIIAALDVDTLKEARRIIRRLGDAVHNYKIGSQLFTAAGPDAVRLLRRHRKNVFLDLKYHDIPSTVARAVRAACRHRVWMLTLHLQTQPAMLEEAARSAREEARRLGITRPLLMGVTVLTSQDATERSSLTKTVLSLAGKARVSALDGVIASARETPYIKKKFGKRLLVVTPGIRPAGASLDDQKRAVTPFEAAKNGCDYMVVGRPIVLAKDPAAAVAEIKKEIRKARR